MIKTVPIHGDQSRCSPGADCCDECRSHKPQKAANPVGVRNMALRRALGDITCDTQGNCYDVTATVTYGDPVSTLCTDPSCMATGKPLPSAASSGGGVSNSALYIGGALLLVILLEGQSRKR